MEENSIEIKEELPKDPYATLETINSSRDISDVLKEENIETNMKIEEKIERSVKS